MEGSSRRAIRPVERRRPIAAQKQERKRNRVRAIAETDERFVAIGITLILPVWLCVSKESDALQLLCAMLLHHGIEARVAPIPSNIGRHAPDAVWVRESDYDRAIALIAQMENVPIGSNWLCRGCSEVNEPQFDMCWKCGKEKMPETA